MQDWEIRYHGLVLGPRTPTCVGIVIVLFPYPMPLATNSLQNHLGL
jgi:hypothetical protein